jgi:hypothetical protein
MKVTIRKMNVVLPEHRQLDVNKRKNKKPSKPKHLWAIVGEHGKTMLQVYSYDYPQDWEDFYNLK